MGRDSIVRAMTVGHTDTFVMSRRKCEDLPRENELRQENPANKNKLVGRWGSKANN
jgi:hypothetical protein